jgi:hypothetical protein
MIHRCFHIASPSLAKFSDGLGAPPRCGHHYLAEECHNEGYFHHLLLQLNQVGRIQRSRGGTLPTATLLVVEVLIEVDVDGVDVVDG